MVLPSNLARSCATSFACGSSVKCDEVDQVGQQQKPIDSETAAEVSPIITWAERFVDSVDSVARASRHGTAKEADAQRQAGWPEDLNAAIRQV